MTNETFSDVYNKALDLLSRREHSQKEIKLSFKKSLKTLKRSMRLLISL
jgi:SOS response regulatory protein OraA/RecX